MEKFAIILLIAVMGQMTLSVPVPAAEPKTTDELVDYVLTNKFYYFDSKAPAMEAELEEMLSEIDKSIAKAAGDSEKIKIYEVAKHFGEKYLMLFRSHKYKCGIRNVFQFMAPVCSRMILATEDENVAIHWYKHFKMFTDEMANYEKSVEQTHDVIEEFTKKNRNTEREYNAKYTQKANEKCDLKVFMNEIH